jgi:hypothetical protein
MNGNNSFAYRPGAREIVMKKFAVLLVVALPASQGCNRDAVKNGSPQFLGIT